MQEELSERDDEKKEEEEERGATLYSFLSWLNCHGIQGLAPEAKLILDRLTVVDNECLIDSYRCMCWPQHGILCFSAACESAAVVSEPKADVFKTITLETVYMRYPHYDDAS